MKRRPKSIGPKGSHVINNSRQAIVTAQLSLLSRAVSSPDCRVGCRYFLSGPRLPYRSQSITLYQTVLLGGSDEYLTE